MRKPLVAILIGVLALTALVLSPTAALAWSNGPAGMQSFGTHDWVMKEADDLARSKGFSWLNLKVALAATDNPDSTIRDFYYHVYDIWGSRYGNSPQRVAEIMTKAKKALVRGDKKKASYWVGLASHYYADTCNPLHTDQTRAEERMHSDYEWAAQRYTDSRDENDAWVDSKPRRISTPSAATKAAAKAAHKDYRRLVTTFNRGGFNGTVRGITKRSLSRAAAGTAGLIIWLGKPGRTTPAPG